MKHRIVFLTAFLAVMVLMTGITGASRNFVANGGFEKPVFTGSWSLYKSIPGWTETNGQQMELETKSLWKPNEGNQYMELDASGSTTIYQDISTEPGATYTLSFAFSPRPSIDDNQLQISWDGKIIGQLSASGAGKTDTDWLHAIYYVTATSDTTRLQFHNLDKSDGTGTFLDNVKLVE